MEIMESISDVEGIFITEDKKVYKTSGIKDIFTLTDEEFTEE